MYKKTLMNFNKKSLLFLLGINIFNSNLYANEESKSFALIPQIGYYEYKEPNVMDIKGPIVGLQLDIFINPKYKRYYFDISSRLAFSYGEYNSPISGKMKDNKSYILKFEPNIYYSLNQNKPFLLDVGMGLGFRYLHNNTSNQFTDVGHVGYLRESHYFYIPLSFKITSLKKNGAIVSRFSYKYFLYGIQKSHLGGTNGIINNKQKNGYGFSFSSMVVTNINIKSTIGFGPYINYWDIKDSEKDKSNNGTTYIEPKNTTTEVGFQLFIKF